MSFGVKDGEWDVEAEEKFARAAELFLRTGRAPNRRTKSIWEDMQYRMSEIYEDVAGSQIDVDLPAGVEELFTGMFKGEAVHPDAGYRSEVGERKKHKPKKRTGREVFEPEDDDLRRRVRRGHGHRTGSYWDQTKAAARKRWAPVSKALAEWGRGWSRVHAAVAPNELNAVFHEVIRRITGSREYISHFKVGRRLDGILGPLSPEDRESFSNVWLTRHLDGVRKMWIDEGRTDRRYALGYTEEQIIADNARLDEWLPSHPEVEEAVRQMESYWDEVRTEVRRAYQGLGLPTEWLDKQGSTYMHHEILTMADTKQTSGQIKAPLGRSYMMSLGGTSEADLNLQYEQAQGVVLTQMLLDAEIARGILRLKKKYSAPVVKEAKEAAKRLNEGVPEEKQKNWKELVPGNYKAWTPRGGKIFFNLSSLIDADYLDALQEEMRTEGKSGVDLKKIMAFMSEQPIFLPAEMVDALNEPVSKKQAARIHKGIVKIWKQWQIASPRRIMRYVLRNLSGDLTKVVTWNPDTLKHMVPASRELFGVIARGRKPSKQMEGWLARAGFSAGLMQQEVAEGDAERVASYLESPRWKRWAKNPVKEYFHATRPVIAYLESISRYATYKSYLAQMRKSKDGTPDNWGASIKEEILGLDNAEDRAYWLSNQLTGAYDQISEHGRATREHIIPFWSFQELNARSHIRLLRNAITTDEAARGWAKRYLGMTAGVRIPIGLAKWGALAWALEGLLATINHTVWSDEEDDLPEDVKNRAHIILGRDSKGNVRYFDRFAVFAEFREWFGMDEAPKLVREYWAGRMTLKEILTEEAGKGAANKFMQGIGGPWKTAGEMLLGYTLFPDAFRPRKIESRTGYLAQSLGLQNEYKAMARLPQRLGGDTRFEAWANTLPEFALYKATPGQSQFYDIRGDRRRFERQRGGAVDMSFHSEKTVALRNMKRALNSGQRDIAATFLRQYGKAGGTARGAKSSFSKMDPLSGMDQQERDEFRKWLGPDGRRRLAAANRHYQRYYKLTPEMKEYLEIVLP